ncbi:hypothetical protein NKDENANG_01199 [Candidatus Entotheonellaceae bacterium PAL068K]
MLPSKLSDRASKVVGSKIGILLFQFPPQNLRMLGGPQRFAERLHAFFMGWPLGPCYAVELRNAALLVPTGLGYDAAKGRYQPFDRLVDPDAANHEAIATRCLGVVDTGRPAFIIASNKAEGSALQTLFRLAERIVDHQSSPASSI